ncbi:MAG: glycosyltransferase family 4 protein [Pyrinomonadaceae bacterium]
MIFLFVFILVFLVSWLAVGAFCKFSGHWNMLDVPNDRSSHETPTPVGAGVVFVSLSLLIATAFELYFYGTLRLWPFYAGGTAIAIVSWVDDRRPLSPFFRILIHVAAAAVCVWNFVGFSTVPSTISPWIYTFLLILSVLWVVWITNAFNFMDGIDGIAGLQGIVGLGVWGFLGYQFGAIDVWVVSVVSIAGVAGFLVHNWPPARVFMGDVGSAFLGFTFGVLPLISLSRFAREGEIWIPYIAVGAVWPFVADSVLTFLRRLISLERVWEPHRTHIYQVLVKQGSEHLTVTIIYGSLALVSGIITIVASIGSSPAIAVIGFVIVATLVTFLPRIARRLT